MKGFLKKDVKSFVFVVSLVLIVFTIILMFVDFQYSLVLILTTFILTAITNFIEIRKENRNNKH